jgi:glycosyltransferase involved in cell wall biosynthesis
MKIVSVMTSDAHGGAEFAAVDMLAALSDRGHETVLLTNQPDVVTGRGVWARAIELGPKLSRASFRGLSLRWPALALRLRHELEREWPYDVLVVHYKKEQLLAATLPERLRAHLIWAEWGPVPKELRHGTARLAYLAAARRARLVMAVSAGTRDSICAVGVSADRVHLVPNALRVDESRFSEAGRARVRTEHRIPLEALVIGCISRFHHKKRNDVAVDAVVRLGRADVHLIMAGEGEAESDLRSRARTLGDRAHFLPTPGTDIANVCSAFDISLFCPSPTEGAPLAVIHAMLASRPCLATAPEGVEGLIVPGAGTIVSPENDPRALADALRGYLDDGARRQREGATARRIAEDRFAAPAVAARIEALLSAA